MFYVFLLFASINLDRWSQGSWDYRAEISLIAKHNRVEVELIEAIISHESNWNPNAGRGSPHKGLMQVGGLPLLGFDPKDSLRGYSKKKWRGKEYNPNFWYDNICAGSFKLRRYINIMGSIEKGVAAYNRGPGGARKWYRKHKGHPYYVKMIFKTKEKLKSLKRERFGPW